MDFVVQSQGAAGVASSRAGLSSMTAVHYRGFDIDKCRLRDGGVVVAVVRTIFRQISNTPKKITVGSDWLYSVIDLLTTYRPAEAMPLVSSRL
jgi:hypothetical protein